MHWSRWGDPDRRATLPEPARALLASIFGEAAPVADVPEAEASLPTIGLPGDVLAQYSDVIGEAYVDTTDSARLRHSGGKSTLDLLRRRAGEARDAPDAVRGRARTRTSSSCCG